MYFFEKINKVNIFFFIVSLIYYTFIWIFHTNWQQNFPIINLPTFIFSKFFALVFVITFFQVPAFFINKIKNKENCDFFKHFFIYFSLNLLFLFICFQQIQYKHEFNEEYINGLNYTINNWNHCLESINVIISYNVLPTLWSTCFCNIFIFSLIFAYIVTNAKKIFSNKKYLLLYLPFCLPVILIANCIPIRMITCSWLLIFTLAFIFFNYNKKITNPFITILFGITVGITCEIRPEYIFMLILLPLLIYLNKLFTPKKLFLFLFVFYLTFFSINSYNNSLNNLDYKLHNLSYIYDEFFIENINDKEIKENEYLLKQVYKKSFEISDLPSTLSEFSNVTVEQKKTAVFLLTKFAIKNSYTLIKKHINQYLFHNYSSSDFFQLNLDKKATLDRNFNIEYIEETTTKNNLINFFSNDYQIFLWNPQICAYLMLFILLGGIIQRKTFFIVTPIIWFSILYIILLFIKWRITLYSFAFVENTYFLTTLFFISTIEQIKNKITNKNTDE